MLEKTGIAPSSSVSIAVAALILGKAVLIADMLPLINRFPNKPVIQIIVFVLISMYCTVHELVRVIGKEKAMRIFFGPMPDPQV
jgi:hypothetical protein